MSVIGNIQAIRSLEVTVVNRNNVVPWRYPPRYEFMYGEWLREEFEKMRKAYLGELIDKWEGMESEVAELAENMKQAIEALLDIDNA